jgi:hypothetical protein
MSTFVNSFSRKRPLDYTTGAIYNLSKSILGILKGDNNVQDMWMQVGQNSEKADKGKEQKQS